MTGIYETLWRSGLVRPRGGRVLGGVCAGLARRVGMDAWPMRWLFLIVLILLPGSPLLIYPLLWIFMPGQDWVDRVHGPSAYPAAFPQEHAQARPQPSYPYAQQPPYAQPSYPYAQRPPYAPQPSDAPQAPYAEQPSAGSQSPTPEPGHADPAAPQDGAGPRDGAAPQDGAEPQDGPR